MPHDEWILIAAAANEDVGLEIEQQSSRPDRYRATLFLGMAELSFNTPRIDWIGQWLGMLELEMGRSIEMENHLALAAGQISLIREDEPGCFILRLSSNDHDASIEIPPAWVEALRVALRDVLMQIGRFQD